MRSLSLLIVIMFVTAFAESCAEPGQSEKPPLDLNRDIRPILAENCFYCHGQDPNKREADLRLDLRDAALKSEAFVPGDAAKSTLVEGINSTHPETQMPPAKSNRPLSAEERKLLDRWINDGAEYQNHWAFI